MVIGYLIPDSVVIRFERLSEDIDIFSRMVNLHITKYPTDDNENINCSSFYRKDQIEKLNELWKDDLEYFNYSFEELSYD